MKTVKKQVTVAENVSYCMIYNILLYVIGFAVVVVIVVVVVAVVFNKWY